jgi:hypothetical protein
MAGKTIRIFLADGAPTGVLTAEIINWTGKLLVAPRSQLSILAKRDEIKRTGVYCLVGPDPEAPHRDRVYIGEGDSVLTRLTAHDKDETKDFWTRTVLVISKDENLTKSHGRYLESQLISMGLKAGRAVIANGTAPAATPLPEPDVADMEYFLEQLQMILPVLGFQFLQPKLELSFAPEARHQDLERFVMRDAGTEAHAIEANGEFVVLKGSIARKQGTKSWDSYKDLREQLVADGLLKDSPQTDFFQFVENVPFTSPSAAAAVVAASNRNGRLTWKLERTGQTYAEWQQAKLDDVAEKDSLADVN